MNTKSKGVEKSTGYFAIFGLATFLLGVFSTLMVQFLFKGYRNYKRAKRNKVYYKMMQLSRSVNLYSPSSMPDSSLFSSTNSKSELCTTLYRISSNKKHTLV